MLRLALLVAVVLSTACVHRTQAVPTAEERRALDFLTRDPFVVIVRLDRDRDGRLVAQTEQGRINRRYRIQPDLAQGGRMRLYRLVDEVILPSEEPTSIGLAVDLRGTK